MRFSRHQNTAQSDPARERGRRKAKLLNDLKGEIREAANASGLGVNELARLMGRDKSTVSRALDPSTNVEAFTLFEFAEVLNKEWSVKLCDRTRDLACLFDDGLSTPLHYKASWAPVVSVACKKAADARHELMSRSGSRIVRRIVQGTKNEIVEAE